MTVTTPPAQMRSAFAANGNRGPLLTGTHEGTAITPLASNNSLCLETGVQDWSNLDSITVNAGASVYLGDSQSNQDLGSLTVNGGTVSIYDNSTNINTMTVNSGYVSMSGYGGYGGNACFSVGPARQLRHPRCRRATERQRDQLRPHGDTGWIRSGTALRYTTAEPFISGSSIESPQWAYSGRIGYANSLLTNSTKKGVIDAGFAWT